MVSYNSRPGKRFLARALVLVARMGWWRWFWIAGLAPRARRSSLAGGGGSAPRGSAPRPPVPRRDRRPRAGNSRQTPPWARLDGGDIPAVAGIERRCQLLLLMRCGPLVSGPTSLRAQHIQGCIALGHRRQARHVTSPLIAIEGVEQVRGPAPSRIGDPDAPAENASATANSASSPRSSPSSGRLPVRSRPRQRPEAATPARRCEERPRRSRSRIENRANESAIGRHAHDCWLWPANVPRRGPSWYDVPAVRS